MTSPSIVLLRTQSDSRLVALAREGHERAFEAIVERYRRQLLRTCRRVLPEARAEDALQQALMAAWHGLERGDEIRGLRPWLHRIAHNNRADDEECGTEALTANREVEEADLKLANGKATFEEIELD